MIGGEKRKREEKRRQGKRKSESRAREESTFLLPTIFLHLMSSFLFSIPSFSFQKGVRKEETGEMRQRDMAERKTARARKRAREREAEERQREREGKEGTTPRGTDVVPLPFLRVILVIGSRRREEKKEKKDQSKEGERERRENEEFTSSISMPIPLS